MRGSILICLVLGFGACTPESQLEHRSVVTPYEPSNQTQHVATAANPLRNAYFGDLHVHTGNSFDAFIFNVKATPDDAYRYAKGETIKHPARFDIALSGPPLDFYAVTDHGEYLGVLRAMKDKSNPLSKAAIAKEMSILRPEKMRAAFGRISASTRSGVRLPEIYDQAFMNLVWQDTRAAADKHYVPGTFTTFAGYEFSSVKARDPKDQSIGGNLHRNVIFRGQAPEQLFTTLDSPNPEDLWAWMDDLRTKEMDALAIPHNSNVSDGHMFSPETYLGTAMDAAYAAARQRNEPLVEITQIKGTSEVHPSQAPNDEWAEFEIYETLLNTQTRGNISGSYIREALSNGIGRQNSDGYNPFKFGLIGSSDTHVAGSGYTEERYWGKMGFVDGKPRQRASVPPRGSKTWTASNTGKDRPFGKWAASGLAGIWAEENTRESLFDGLKRKEAFATSGPRIKVRFFASSEFDNALLGQADMLTRAYASGVPMGGTLSSEDTAPKFLTWAMRDPEAAPLQRLQVIKVWNEADMPGERVYDVACAVGEPDPETRQCPDDKMDVDISTCQISGEGGAPELRALWTDPDFNADHNAAYYVRVLEVPTCRWSTWDALKAGTPPNPTLPPTVQERAWTSPIWYEAAE